MTTPTQDARDGVIRMERKVEQLERKIDDLDAKVTEMHQLLTQAKGARWILMLMIGVGGIRGGYPTSDHQCEDVWSTW